MERHWNVDLRYTIQDAISPLFRLYIIMDSVTLTLVSFIQRYLAKAQDNINILLEHEYCYLMSVGQPENECFCLHLYWGLIIRDFVHCFIWNQEM